MRPAIDRMLEEARGRFTRVDAPSAAGELAGGACLVDIRTESQRSAQGEIPGALVIDRTVLEWRLDPTSTSRLGQMTDSGARIIVICAEGFSSSLAAASLIQLGLTNVSDVIGGFEAWSAAGLPVTAQPVGAPRP